MFKVIEECFDKSNGRDEEQILGGEIRKIDSPNPPN